MKNMKVLSKMQKISYILFIMLMLIGPDYSHSIVEGGFELIS